MKAVLGLRDVQEVRKDDKCIIMLRSCSVVSVMFDPERSTGLDKCRRYRCRYFDDVNSELSRAKFLASKNR